MEKIEISNVERHSINPKFQSKAYSDVYKMDCEEGFEIDDDYFKEGCKRFDIYKSQQTLF